MTLAEFIAACVAEVALRRAAEQAEETQRETDLQQLRQTVRTSIRQRVRAAIPTELRPFADYAGEQPTREQLIDYPARWSPSDFKVEAPGLNLITFTVRADSPELPMIVTEIRVGANKFGTDWIEAVAAAVIVGG